MQARVQSHIITATAASAVVVAAAGSAAESGSGGHASHDVPRSDKWG